MYIFCCMYIKILLFTVHHYFIYLIHQASNIQYNQSRILKLYISIISGTFHSLHLTSARSCNYSCTSSWWWVSTPETRRATYRNIINWTQSHLVGQVLNLTWRKLLSYLPKRRVGLYKMKLKQWTWTKPQMTMFYKICHCVRPEG
jgi:hypothetical protein